MGVNFPPRRHYIDAASLQKDGCGTERGVNHHFAVQMFRQLPGQEWCITLYYEIQVFDGHSDQNVADRASHQIHR